MNTFLTILAVVILLWSLVTLVAVFSIKIDVNHIAHKASWHYKLYQWLSYSGRHYKACSAPNTICSYYWSYVLKIFFLPLTLPILLFGTIFRQYRDSDKLVIATWIFWIYNIMGFVMGIAIFDPKDNYTGSWLVLHLVGLGVWTGIFFLYILIALAIVAWREHNRKKKGLYYKPKQSLLVSRFKSWKDNNCPMIHWR